MGTRGSKRPRMSWAGEPDWPETEIEWGQKPNGVEMLSKAAVCWLGYRERTWEAGGKEPGVSSWGVGLWQSLVITFQLQLTVPKSLFLLSLVVPVSHKVPRNCPQTVMRLSPCSKWSGDIAKPCFLRLVVGPIVVSRGRARKHAVWWLDFRCSPIARLHFSLMGNWLNCSTQCEGTTFVAAAVG